MPCGNYSYGDCEQVRNFQLQIRLSKEGLKFGGIASGRLTFTEEEAIRIKHEQEIEERKKQVLDYQI